MKERIGGQSRRTIDADNRGSEHSGSSDYGGHIRESAQAKASNGGNGPDASRNIPAMARLRAEATANGNSHSRDWSDYAIIAGAILLAGAIIGTLIIVSGINARANQLVANDATRAASGAVIVERLERKLDDHNAASLAHFSQPPPTVVVNVYTTNDRRTTVQTPTTQPPRTTPTATTTSTTRPPVAPTPPLDQSPPCRLAVLNVCLLR